MKFVRSALRAAGSRAVRFPPRSHLRARDRSTAHLLMRAIAIGVSLSLLGVLSIIGTTLVSLPAASGSSLPLTRVSVLPGGKAQTISVPSGDAFYTLPVPPGTRPAEFVADILVRGPVIGGIATVITPTTAYPINLKKIGGVSRVAVPLSAADVSNAQVTLQLQVGLTEAPSRLNASACVPPPAIVAQVESAYGVFSGRLLPPRSPADFWPATLQKATVWLPHLEGLTTQDRQAVARAALQLAAVIAQQFGQQTKLLFRTGSPPPHAISPVARDVEVAISRSGPPSLLGVKYAGGAPVLLVSGRGAGLVAAARATTLRNIALATSSASAVRTSSLGPSPSQVTETASGRREITLSQLGGSTSLEGVGTTSLTDLVPQAQFGTPISSMQIRVQATYTPPPAGGQATFSVLVNGYIVASQALGLSGQLGLNATVPQPILSRVQSVVFRLDYAPPGGVCHTGLLPVQVTLNPSSGFLGVPGESLAPGFIRQPQDFASRLPVDLVALSDTQLIDGCRLVAALSEILPSVPDVELTTTAAAIAGSSPVVVVGATPSLTRRLGAPLQLAPFRSVASPGDAVGYVVRQPFAAIESFSQHQRDVVLLGAYAQPSLVSVLTHEILTAQNGWYSLGTGELAVTTADRRLRVVPAAALLPQLVGATTTNGIGIPQWLLIAVAVLVALVAGRLAWLAVRMSRLRRRAHRAVTTAGGAEERGAAGRESPDEPGEDGPFPRPGAGAG